MSLPDSIRRWPLRSLRRTSRKTRTSSPASLLCPTLLTLLLIGSLVPSCWSKSSGKIISKRFRVPNTTTGGAGRRSLQSDARGGAIQSGPDNVGPSYAAAAVYNDASETLHITGTTYGDYFAPYGANVTGETSSCFYAVVEIDPTENNSMEWITLQQMGVDMVNEACQDMYMDERTKHMYITGQAQPDGLLASLSAPGIAGENQVQLGMILDYSFDSDNSWSELKLIGGQILQDGPVVYPVAMASENGSDGILYQVSMESFDYARNEMSSTDPNDVTNTLPVDPADHYLYGKSYYMRVKGYKANTSIHYSSSGLQKTLKNAWGGEILATSASESVFVSGIITTADHVYVAGTTKGTGGAGFGLATYGVSISPDDFDGFVTKFSPNSGEVSDPSGANSDTMAYRVAAATGTNDWVSGICTSGDAAAVVGASNYIYITGATGGMISKQVTDESTTAAQDDKIRAYVAKINTLTMTLEWAVNLESNPVSGADNSTAIVRGISCASTRYGEAVFVAGVVENGSVLPDSGTLASMGGTDVFVAKITSDGDISFIKQMGSAHEDTVAKRGGVVTMPNGDAIVVGNTKGAIYRNRQEEDGDSFTVGTVSDIFAFTIDGDSGDFVFPLDHEGFSGLPVNNPPPEPVPAPTEPVPTPTEPAPAPQPEPEPSPFPPPTPIVYAPETTADQAAAGNGSGVEKWVILLLLLMGGVMAIFLSVWYVNSHVMPQKDIGTDRSKVLEYLHGFDVEDVDLKHSATGGWHCSYANALAQGINDASTSRSSCANTSGDGLLGSDDDADLIHTFDPLTGSSSKPLDSGNSLFGDSLSNHTSHIIEAEGITFGGARGSRPRLTRGASKRMASGNTGLGGSNAQYDGLMNSSSYESDGGFGGSSPPSNNATSRKKEQWGRDIV